MFIASYENTMRNARPKLFVPVEIVRTVEQIREEKRAEAARVAREEAAAWVAKIEREREEAAQKALSLRAIQFYRVIDIRDTKTPVRQIIEQVGVFHGISYDDIVGVSRCRSVVAARHDAMRAVRTTRTDLSTPQIGKAFNRDHTSVLHALGRLKKR